MRNLRLVPILALGLYGAACDKIFGGSAGPEVLNEGKAKLEAGDIPGGYNASSRPAPPTQTPSMPSTARPTRT